MVFLVFIDESGKPTPATNDPFVVTALIVNEKAYLGLEDKLNNVVNWFVTYIKEKFSINVPADIELHAKELVQNKGPYRHIPISVRAELFEKVLRCAANFAERGLLSAIGVVIIKQKVLNNKNRREAEEIVVRKAFQLLIERIVWFLQEQDEESLALLLVDRSEVNEHIDCAVRYELLEGIYTSRLEASRRIFDQPMFIDSKRFRTLQLADLIAYTIRRVMAKMPKAAGGVFDFEKWYNEIILRKILRRSSTGEVKGYGLKVWVE